MCVSLIVLTVIFRLTVVLVIDVLTVVRLVVAVGGVFVGVIH